MFDSLFTPCSVPVVKQLPAEDDDDHHHHYHHHVHPHPYDHTLPIPERHIHTYYILLWSPFTYICTGFYLAIQLDSTCTSSPTFRSCFHFSCHTLVPTGLACKPPPRTPPLSLQPSPSQLFGAPFPYHLSVHHKSLHFIYSPLPHMVALRVLPQYVRSTFPARTLPPRASPLCTSALQWRCACLLPRSGGVAYIPPFAWMPKNLSWAQWSLRSFKWASIVGSQGKCTVRVTLDRPSLLRLPKSSHTAPRARMPLSFTFPSPCLPRVALHFSCQGPY